MATGFKKATVNASRVPSTQTNFPAYIDLSRIGITTTAEAQSVRVYADAAKTTEWAREIVNAVIMYVKIPSLTSATEIYVDWDGVRSDYAVSDTYGARNVWNGFPYAGVWHFATESSGTRNDSTSNQNNLSQNGTVGAQTTGNKLPGNAAEFTGSTSNYLSIAHASQTGLNMHTTDKVTVSGWISPRGYSSTEGVVASKYTHPSGQAYMFLFTFSSSSSTSSGFWFSAAGNTNVAVPTLTHSSPMTTGNWYHFVATLDAPLAGKDYELYLNGTSIGSANDTQSISEIFNTTAPFHIGRRGDAAFPLNAYLQEVRIREGITDADWVTTEYNNQNDEADFWGTWTDVSRPSPFLLMLVN